MADRIWGWNEFFDNISSLLAGANRQYGTANNRYSQYIIERLEMCIMSVAHIKDTIRDSIEGMSSSDEDLTVYLFQLKELLACLRQLSALWENYFDQLELQISVAGYAVHVDRSHRRLGCPQLDVGRDQLEHLLSLSFNCTQIASILGSFRNDSVSQETGICLVETL